MRNATRTIAAVLAAIFTISALSVTAAPAIADEPACPLGVCLPETPPVDEPCPLGVCDGGEAPSCETTTKHFEGIVDALVGDLAARDAKILDLYAVVQTRDAKIERQAARIERLREKLAARR